MHFDDVSVKNLRQFACLITHFISCSVFFTSFFVFLWFLCKSERKNHLNIPFESKNNSFKRLFHYKYLDFYSRSGLGKIVRSSTTLPSVYSKTRLTTEYNFITIILNGQKFFPKSEKKRELKCKVTWYLIERF